MVSKKMIELTGADNIKQAQLLTFIKGIELEIAGFRKRGRSCYALAKSLYKLKGSRVNVLKQLNAMIRPFDRFKKPDVQISYKEDFGIIADVIFTKHNLTQEIEIEEVDILQIDVACIMEERGSEDVDLPADITKVFNLLALDYLTNNPTAADLTIDSNTINLSERHQSDGK